MIVVFVIVLAQSAISLRQIAAAANGPPEIAATHAVYRSPHPLSLSTERA
jgi:hypothetical protein